MFVLIVIVLLGLVLVALEIVAIPGGVAGICGALLTLVGIWQMYVSQGAKAGLATLLSSLVVLAALLVFFMKSRTWKKVSLDEQVDSRVNTIDVQAIVPGAKGHTLSRLAPMGKALIEGETVEVSTFSEFIDENCPIEVVQVEGNKIYVQECK